jgi:outer membrane usher protein
VQTLNYQSYLDAIDLDPGDYEYGAYLGVTGLPSFGQPDYSDGELGFSGYWRKAFVDRPALGVGLQASRRVQMLNAQTQMILRNGSRLTFQGAVSRSDGVGDGYAAIAAWDMLIDRETTSDYLSLQVEHTSENFATLGDPTAFNPVSWQAFAQYSRTFSDRLYGSLGVAYSRTRADAGIGDSRRVDASLHYTLNREWSVQGGVNYVEYEGSSVRTARNGAGFTIGLTWRPAPDRRGDARYDDALQAASASYVKTPRNVVGDVGYSVLATYDDGPGSVAGSLSYVGNRMDVGVSHTAYGDDFRSIGDEHITTAYVASSFAWAGGRGAIGRRISDSFAILYGHPSLDDRPVIAGEVLRDGRYTAASGPMGPVLYPFLGSYTNDSIFYDVLDAPAGYDIGDGVIRVYPHYRSGFAFEIGSAAFVSAVGNVTGVGADGPVPLALVGGRVTMIDGPDGAEPTPFFTNTVGRFAIQGLEPGRRYRVELFTHPRSGFDFVVPADNDGLLDLRSVHVAIPVAED